MIPTDVRINYLDITISMLKLMRDIEVYESMKESRKIGLTQEESYAEVDFCIEAWLKEDNGYLEAYRDTIRSKN